MAYTKDKKVYIMRKELVSAFVNANIKHIKDPNWKIGASMNKGGINRGLTLGAEEASLLPSVIGVSANSADFSKQSNHYWNSISKPVPEGGLPLDIGWVYELNNPDKKEYIKDLQKTNSDIKTDKDLAMYVEDKVSEQEKYKYGTPTNISDYILYRYCLVYGDVANTEEDMNKSNKIRFYIYDEKVKVDRTKELHSIKNEAKKLYLDILADEAKVNNVLYVSGLDIHNLSDVDKHIKLEQLSESKPNDFIRIVKDKSLETKALIESCIFFGFLKRVANTPIIMDNDNVQVGSTIDDAIAFINSEKGNKLKNELITKVKNYKK